VLECKGITNQGAGVMVFDDLCGKKGKGDEKGRGAEAGAGG
jgi:hypothetical protein